ncbi:MAG: aminomethyl-transferring glycine dehydrogenase [Verrucomicrobiales bacterium]|nr:aminomethyl-transferring glycine dehydrogenase [Verrucomicrobiales bacterium]
MKLTPTSSEGINQNPFAWSDRFVRRHIGPQSSATEAMLKVCGFDTLDQLIGTAVPQTIRLAQDLHLPPSRSEHGLLAELRVIATQNQIFKSYLGLGYHDTITPPVIQRNILENPGWYTQYTPYQAEIAQGRLEACLNFQTLVTDLTGLEIANASLLDEGTAAAEAVAMCQSVKGTPQNQAIFISEACHPQTVEVVKTRAEVLGIRVIVGSHHTFDFSTPVFAILLQYPATDGTVYDYSAIIEQAHTHQAMAIVAADPLSLTLLKPPGEFGADVAVGSMQRFGVPLGYGGPHAGYFATRDAFKRHMPGRLVGVSKDARGKAALRLTLQTREQHIRRDKATSNICTAQVLLAVMASMYAVYHGPEGLKLIAQRIQRMTQAFARGVQRLGHEIANETYFDTVRVRLQGRSSKELVQAAESHRINLRVFDSESVGVSLDEATSAEDLEALLRVFHQGRPLPFALTELAHDTTPSWPANLSRTSSYLTHPVFNRFHSETEMLRYIRRLESRDLSLTTSMIPLGSCTMKLNATAEMLPVTWPEFGKLHPFAPAHQAVGYQTLFSQLESWLSEITGFAATSLQPNAGSQGEYAGLLVIRRYHLQRGEGHRTICLIPSSAHGTNPASAVMAGMKVVAVACDAQGNIDVADLKAKAAAYSANLAALMITYPSTHGVFESSIRDICAAVHQHGGQVYMDGANMNAQVGLCRPGDIGADVCHLNLHKTFCIPHGGGGPGVGPICVARHLANLLPRHPLVSTGGSDGIGPVSAAPWGSASILVIPWMYIRLMGGDGLTQATKMAILNANYIARRLDAYFPVLYRGQGSLVAHECILDLRSLKQVTVEDVAKRLMDYGFHAPTVSWPVPSTLMIEPTESESKEELDRFCDAMISIHGEIVPIESGAVDPKNNLLKNAPHTADVLLTETWTRPYSREQAAFPAPWLKEHKFWPAVARIDNVFGDRNPVCSCTGMDAYSAT